MFDLVLPGSGLTGFDEAYIINDRGEIVVKGQLPNSDHHAILLIPCDEDHPQVEGCDYDLFDPATAAEVGAAPLTPPTAPITAQPNLSLADRMPRIHPMVAGRHGRFGALPLN